MAERFRPTNHGDEHRPVGWNGATDPGGPDPMNWLERGSAPVIGERYKATSSQSINDSSYTQVTSWDSDPDGSNIEDAGVIDSATNGLSIESAGYFIIQAAATWSGIGTTPVNGSISIEVGTAGVGQEFDRFTSQNMAGDASAATTSRVVALTYIEAGKTLTVYAYHETGAARSVSAVTLKVVRIHASPPVPYWVPL